MTNNEIQKWRLRASALIAGKRLNEAFRILRSMTPGQSWRVVNEIDKAEEDYALMLNYAMDGASDPHRNEVYDGIVGRLYALVDRVSREATMKDSPTLYFSSVRYENMQLDTVTSLVGAYRRLCDNTSLFNMATGGTTGSDDRQEKERMEHRLFTKVWTTAPLGRDDAEVLGLLWNDAVIPSYFKELMVSALLMGGLEYYDEAGLTLLLKAYSEGDMRLSVKALCAALILMSVHCERMSGSGLASRIAALRDTSGWKDDVKMVFLQFIRSRDTEKINRKVRDELMPEMLKLRPDIYKKIHDQSQDADLASIEENPEWQEIFEESGIADRMKELSEMQEDGGDVFMSTFSMLKTFPFFNDISNWFLPFHLEHSSVDNADETVNELLLSSPFLCDSDKYSFMFSVKQVPEAQRRMMLSQIGSQNINLAELRNAELMADEKARENVANKYVQDLYRFFKLFRRKGEFRDPFATPLNLVQVPLLCDDLRDEATLRLVGEFYFRRGYYSDALMLFGMLADMVPPEASLYQKMGYACQQTGDPMVALGWYEKAELLNAESVWTLRRIALVHRVMGNPAKALEYFMRVEAKTPDDLNVALNIGHCLLELGRYREAMKYYYKVEFIGGGSPRIWRPLAWCAFLNRDFDQSRKYYDCLIKESTPNASDYLNMGHLAVANGDYRDAMNYYKLKMSADGESVDRLVESVKADIPALATAGVDTGILPLVIDALLYSIS